MTTAIIDTVRQIKITDVQDVILTEVTTDAGRFVRALRIYGTPAVPGGLPTLEILLDSDAAASIKITSQNVDL